MERITYDGKIVSIIHRDSDWVKGLNFITPNELFVQVGTWWYDKGKKLDSHIHNEFNRNSIKLIMVGRHKVDMFKTSNTFLGKYLLNPKWFFGF